MFMTLNTTKETLTPEKPRNLNNKVYLFTTAADVINGRC